MAASLHLPSRRRSRRYCPSRQKNRSTPRALVNTSHWGRSSSSRGRSSGGSRGSNPSRVVQTTWAPRGSSSSRWAWTSSPVPAQPTRRPARGRRSPWVRRRAATSPTTMTAGACTSRASRAMSARVPRTSAGWALFPPDTTATGVSGARPSSIRRRAMTSRCPRPMRNTSVPPHRARAAKFSGRPSGVWAVWPVMTWKLRLKPRWVTGMPAPAGMATAEVIPGTSSQGTPARFRASSSSPPRPKTKGSPPFSRTTVLPAWARAMRAAEISPWGAECFPHRLPR